MRTTSELGNADAALITHISDRSVRVRDVRASVHSTAIAIPLLDGRVAGYGREEQREFVFCEVETDDGLTGVAVTGHFLARSVVVALKSYLLPVVRDMDA